MLLPGEVLGGRELEAGVEGGGPAVGVAFVLMVEDKGEV